MVDASLRATILESLKKLHTDFGISFLYITHDLTTAYQISDNIIVLYRGCVAEVGDVDLVIKNPQHPYSRLLISSIPTPDFDDRGYLRCVPRWSGDDGPDDALENVLNWTVLHALGGSDRVLALYKRALEGHFRQYTEARTTEVELGRDGMYYQEFHACFDWFHHGEAWSVILLQGLSDPVRPDVDQPHAALVELVYGRRPAHPEL